MLVIYPDFSMVNTLPKFISELSNVFYFLSKTVSILIDTVFMHGLLLAVLLVFMLIKKTRKFAVLGLIIVCGASLLITVIPVGNILSRPLEIRFKKPELSQIEFAGIVTLAGSLDPDSYLERGEMNVLSSADRIFAMLRFASLYPDKPVLFTGGDGNLTEREFSEAVVLENWLDDSGLKTPNMYFEAHSRNTHENATKSLEMVYRDWPELSRKPWVLITSAQHMPRAAGAFRQAGWNVIPYPVDRFTSDELHLASLNVSEAIYNLGRALREWVGLTAYYWTGRTDAWFPGPQAPGAEN
ncbi:YdcF family protein [Thalassospira sp. HJ]|uniref:YdcF family protein n=1 Tax=Thalassospira sp. HJ TaxID=1616823 RepID=UPI000697B4DB|nr:YdcF family protein [Thalassospira sp. HJ]